MINDELQAWAMQAWQKEVLKNMPAAKAARQLKDGQRESRKVLGRAQKSFSAQQASTKRMLNTRLAEIEQEFRDRREAQDREFEERRWALIVDSQ